MIAWVPPSIPQLRAPGLKKAIKGRGREISNRRWKPQRKGDCREGSETQDPEDPNTPPSLAQSWPQDRVPQDHIVPA